MLHGDPASFSPKVFKYLFERFLIKSVLDVGAGLGFTSAYLNKKYQVPVIALEGHPYNVLNAHYPVIQHDLTKSVFQCSPVDLTICIEVAEHIAPEHVETFLNTLCNGKLVLMTHALPGQNGEYHLNEQNSDYWINLMSKRGYALLAMDTNIVRSLAQKEEHCVTYLAQSGLLFSRIDVQEPITLVGPLAQQLQEQAQKAKQAKQEQQTEQTQQSAQAQAKTTTQNKESANKTEEQKHLKTKSKKKPIAKR